MLAKNGSAPTFAFSTKFISFSCFSMSSSLEYNVFFHWYIIMLTSCEKELAYSLKKLCVPLCAKMCMEGREQLCGAGSLLDLYAGSEHQIQVFRLV